MSVSGVLVLDKPQGMTSHDVVARVRRVLHTRRVGHAGTLDPDATGVLVVCVGDATRLVEYAAAAEKSYEAVAVFGASTETDDAAGAVLQTKSAAGLGEADLADKLPAFVGEQLQRAPRVSALHIDGQRAHALVRRGEVFETPTRTIVIHALDLLSFEPGEYAKARLRVRCSKGTYIRALCRDLGEALEVPAHLGALCRTQSGAFALDTAVPLAVFESLDHPEQTLLPLRAAVQGLPSIAIDTIRCERLAHGQSVWLEDRTQPIAGPVAAFAEDGRLAAIVHLEAQPTGMTAVPKKVFWKKETAWNESP